MVGSTRRTATVAMAARDSTSASRSDSGLDMPPVPRMRREGNTRTAIVKSAQVASALTAAPFDSDAVEVGADAYADGVGDGRALIRSHGTAATDIRWNEYPPGRRND